MQPGVIARVALERLAQRRRVGREQQRPYHQKDNALQKWQKQPEQAEEYKQNPDNEHCGAFCLFEHNYYSPGQLAAAV